MVCDSSSSQVVAFTGVVQHPCSRRCSNAQRVFFSTAFSDDISGSLSGTCVSGSVAVLSGSAVLLLSPSKQMCVLVLENLSPTSPLGHASCTNTVVCLVLPAKVLSRIHPLWPSFLFLQFSHEAHAGHRTVVFYTVPTSVSQRGFREFTKSPKK